MHELSRAQARRIAVQAQLLGSERPSDLMAMARHLTMLQVDATAAVAPSADLVAWSRLGAGYVRDELAAALDGRALVELRGIIRPAEDIALYRAEMARWAGDEPLDGWREAWRRWVQANDACRRDILDRLATDGPTPARDMPDSCAVAWKSSGWTNDRNVTQLLELMALRGEVAVAGRRGTDRLWDLAERIYPDDPVVPIAEARHTRDALRLRALGIARSRATESSVEPNDVGEAGEPAVVHGIKGEWRVDPHLLDRPFAGRTVLLSPLDRLVYDRKRMVELFEFDYQLEMYKPVARRKWGYWALPILSGDRLVGKVDAAADRKAGVLRVHAIHRDVDFTDATVAEVDGELAELADWLELELLLVR